MLGGDAMIGVREWRMHHFRWHSTEILLVRIDLAAQSHTHQRTAMKGTGKGNHARTTGVSARHFHRILNSFCASGDQHGLLFEIARCHCIQALCQRHITLIRRHMEAGMCEALCLFGNSRHNLWVTMTGIIHGNASRKIDEATAIHVPQFSIFSSFCINATRGHTLRNGRSAPILQSGCLSHAFSPMLNNSIYRTISMLNILRNSFLTLLTFASRLLF